MNLLRFLCPILLACATLGRPSAAETNRWFPGLTEPFLDIALSAPLPGTISNLCFLAGQPVNKGETIVEIDRSLEQLNVDRARLMRDNLKIELEAIRKVYQSTRSESREAVEKKELEYNLTIVEYDRAIEILRKRRLVAPFDGVIKEFFLNVGEYCRTEDKVLQFVEIRRCLLTVNLDARIGYPLKLGQEVPVSVEAGDTELSLTGRIHYIAPVVHAASGLLKIKVLIDNADGRIRPGVLGKMQLPSSPDDR